MGLARGRLYLGINCAYHESAAALVRGGEVIYAVEEERFTRTKHAKRPSVSNPDELPWNAIRACLEFVPEVRLCDLDAIAISLAPGRRLALIGGDPYELDDDTGFGSAAGEEEFNRRVLGIPHTLARAGGDSSIARRFHFVPHHRAHAASAYYASPFAHAAILVVDGIGEESTAWLGRGTEKGLQVLEEIAYPHSIGMLWERIAVYLGFTERDACKVMGLAAYGDDRRFAAEYDRLFPVLSCGLGLNCRDKPPFRVDAGLARLRSDRVCGLESLFGPRRRPEEPPELGRFADVAAGLQRQTEAAVLALARRLAQATGELDLCFAGGVALNCVANARLERDGPFQSLFVLGAAHDAGTAIGAALDVAYEKDVTLRAKRTAQPRALPPFLGPSYDCAAIEAAIARSGFSSERVPDAAGIAASLLAKGEIVGWFQGRSEFGPRALGNRSLLADPRRAGMREELNRRIKHRELFRPFGASVLSDDAEEWFLFPGDRDGAASCRGFMIMAYHVLPDQAPRIPAVVHQDGTCRAQFVDAKQNSLFHSLINRFRELTGIPLVLNTSFNDQEPLVATPDDALKTFARAGIDVLFLGDRLVRRAR
jgi:carbamoyltransferase